MSSRLDESLRQTPLSLARRIFAIQQVLERAEALNRRDLCARLQILLDRELDWLRRRHPLKVGVDDSVAKNNGRQSYFLQTIAYIIDHEPSAEATYLLEPVHHQLDRLRNFRPRPLPVEIQPLIYC